MFDVEEIAKLRHALGDSGLCNPNFARHHGLVFASKDATNRLDPDSHALEVAGGDIGNPIESLYEGGKESVGISRLRRCTEAVFVDGIVRKIHRMD